MSPSGKGSPGKGGKAGGKGGGKSSKGSARGPAAPRRSTVPAAQGGGRGAGAGRAPAAVKAAPDGRRSRANRPVSGFFITANSTATFSASSGCPIPCSSLVWKRSSSIWVWVGPWPNPPSSRERCET